MTPPRSSTASGGPNYFLLFGCLIVCYLPSLAGWIFPPGAWFESLQKPDWNPPNWLFGPVWTLLYFLMGIALYRIVRRGQSPARKSPARRVALALFGVQLALNAAWTPVFFGAREIGWALVVIVLLDFVVATALFKVGQVDRLASLMLAPYLGWILFATALNATLWRLNPGV